MPKDIKKVKVVKIKDPEEAIPIKGGELWPQSSLYPRNVFFAAPTRSGKSQMLWHILRNTVGPDTTLFLFSSTATVDPLYIQMIQKMQKKHKVIVYNSIFEGKINQLEVVLDTMKSLVVNEREGKGKEDSPQTKGPVMLFNAVPVKVPEPKPQPEPKPKFRAPKFTIVLDDLTSTDLRSKYISFALRTARQYQCQMYLVSQSLIHLTPESFANLTHLAIGKGFSKDMIESVHSKFQLSLDADSFFGLYTLCTQQPYQFFVTDLRKGVFYANFDRLPVKALLGEE